MVNVYGDFSETGYNNPYYVKPADTRGQADYQNTTGRSNRDRVNLGTNYGEAGQYYNQQQQAQAQQQPQQQQPQSSPVTVVVPQQPRGDAYDMATEAARRGDAIDPAVLQKAREQGFTGTVTPNLIVPGAANRLATTRNLANMRGNLYGTDATAFTAMNATFVGRSAVPKFAPVEGSVTQRFAFDEYGKVLKGGAFEPAFNSTNIPYNPKMGSGDYAYVGEFRYGTGEIVSRYYERSVGSYVDFSEAGAMAQHAVIVRSGGSPGSYGETNKPKEQVLGGYYPTGEIGVIKQPEGQVKVSQRTPLEEANFRVIGALGIGAQGIEQGQQQPSPRTPSYTDNAIAEAAEGMKQSPFGGLLGATFWGDKKDAVLGGFAASVIDFFPGMVGWTPMKDRMQTTDTRLDQFRQQNKELQGTAPNVTAYNENVKAFQTDQEAFRPVVDTFNRDTSAYQERLTKYNANPTTEEYTKLSAEKSALDLRYGEIQKQQSVFDTRLTELESKRAGITEFQGSYDKFLQQNKESGVLVKPPTAPGYIENPELTYDYGEFSKWGVGAGDWVKNRLGFNREQLEAYGLQVEQKQGLSTIPEKLVYGTGYTISTRPEKIVTAYGAGAAMVVGGAAVAGASEASGLAATLTAAGEAHPVAAAATGMTVRAGVPLVLGGLTYYGVSEGFTATPERTTVNIGKVLPEFGGLVLGGGTAAAGIRALDAGYGGFSTKKTAYLKGWEDRAKVTEFTAKREGATGDKKITIDASGKPIVSVVGQEPVTAPTVRDIRGTMVTPRTSELVLPHGKPAPLSVEAVRWQDSGIISTPDIRNIGDVIYRPEVSKGYTNLGSKTFTTEHYGMQPADVPPVPVDLMPGVNLRAGRSAEVLPMKTNVWADLLKLKVEPVQSPKGLGKITGASQVTVNPEIRASTRAGTTVQSVDTLMERQMRFDAYRKTASQQRVADIIPRTIKPEPAVIGNVESILTGILESEKRPVTSTPQWKPVTGVDMGYGNYGPARALTDTTTSAEYNNAMWKVWIKPKEGAIVAPELVNVRGTVSPTKPGTIEVAGQAGITKPGSIVSPGRGTRTIDTQVNRVGVTPIEETVQPQKQIQLVLAAPTYPQPSRAVTGYTPAPEPATPKRQETIKPMAPFPVTPGVPVIPYTPAPTKPYPDEPFVRQPFMPIIPILPSLPSGGGAGPLTRKRQRKFLEIFPMGLDISMYGRRTIPRRVGKRPTKPKKKKGSKK